MKDFFNHIDMREEMDFLIEGSNAKVLYIRSNKDTRCKCFDPLHKSGSAECIICGGSGYLSSIEVMNTFSTQTSSRDKAGTAGETNTELGKANIVSKDFYFRYDKKVSTGDKILVVGFDKKDLPTEIIEIYTVGVYRDIRGKNNRIEYVKAACKSSPQNIILEQKRLNKVPNEHKVKLMKGVKYQWGN